MSRRCYRRFFYLPRRSRWGFLLPKRNYMKKANIILSDITCMKEKFCIAGFDTYEKRMKRLMLDGGYWDASQIPTTYCEILVDNEEFKEPRDYPHRTEDVNIDIDSIEVLREFEPDKELANTLKESLSKDIQSIFHHHVKENAYVTQKTKCPSLGAILIPAHNIEFFTEGGKLRARITDFSNQTYELKVSCKYLRDIFEQDKDVVALNNAIAASQYAHCRIGLARKFLMQENHCYLMLNGLFLY